MKLFFAIPAFLCLAVSAWSQTPRPTPAKSAPPSGPLLRAPDDFSKWEIVSTYPRKGQKKEKESHVTKDPTASESSLRKLVTTKTGRIVHEERSDISQHTTEVWYEGGTQYTKSSDSPVWYRADSPVGGNATGDVAYYPLPNIGYRDVDLITAENYAGTILYHNRTCLVFVPGGKRTIDLNSVGDSQKKLKGMQEAAYVDADTRLPVEVRTRAESRTFQFDPPPTQMQTLPADLVAQTKNGEDERVRLNQPAPRPY